LKNAEWSSVMKKQQSGFTLVEIAIVLVIIGLLLGGVLKGQEMITSAKVRNLADQGSAIKTAFYAFQDRYRAVPGDYANASNNINGVAGGANGGNGSGNGLVDTNNDRGLFWLQLSAAGFITGNYDGQAAANNTTCGSTTCPTNTYGAPMMFSWGNNADNNNTRSAHELRTGRGVPVEVLAELDRKIDDGAPRTGSFMVDRTVSANQCRQGGVNNSNYRIVSNNPESNCAGVHVL